MSCGCPNLLIELKQGEALSVGCTVMQDDGTGINIPVDLLTYTITVEVKRGPVKTAPTLFTKNITTNSQDNVDGRIFSPSTGEFAIRFNQSDTSIPQGDYAIVIFLKQGEDIQIVSSPPEQSAILRIGPQ